MSCQRNVEIDLAAFESDRTAPQWSAFRDHYPRCPECTRAVARFGRLREALRSQTEPGEARHPDEAELLAFAGDPAALPTARRGALEVHLAGCPPCRTELAVLRGFDFAALGVAASAPARAVAEPTTTLGARLAAWLEAALAPLGQPAYALAAIVLLAIPVGIAVWRWAERADAPGPPPIAHEAPAEASPTPPEPTGERVPTGLAQESVPAPRVLAPEGTAPEAPVPAPEALAAREAPVPAAREAPVPAPREAPAPGSASAQERLAQAPSPPRPTSVPEAAIDLAALLPEQAPTYRPQLALAGGSFAAVRTSSAIRSAGAPLPTALPLAPEHVAATLDPSPTLYWYLSAPSEVPVELTVIDEDGVAPLLEHRIAPPVAAGLHALSLSEHGLRLAAGKTYHYYVALVRDARRRDLDALTGAAIRYGPDAEAERRVAAAGPARRAHALAEAGYWLDAFDAIHRLAQAHPASATAADHRAALLEQVGQGEVVRGLVREKH